MKRYILLASIALLLTVLVAGWRFSQEPAAAALTPAISGQVEYCLTCHADLPVISRSHPIETFGCVSCHGGERLALDADLAHSTLRGGANPSDLSVVEASCGGGDCHSGSAQDDRDHIQRVLTSLQATYAGAITSLRYTFGAQPDLTAQQGVQAVEDPNTSATGVLSLSQFDPTPADSPSLMAFAENCMHCHLSAEPPEGAEYARLTGCAACHSPAAGASGDQPVHQLTTAIAYTQCNTCHNRGNYDLGDMQFHERSDHPTDRLNDYYQPITQFTRCEWTLDCIDCHTRQEAMGDGDIHSNQKDMQYVQCKTCHGTIDELPLTRTISNPNDLALRLAFLNPVIDLKTGDTILVTEKGEPIWNARQLPDGSFELFGKATGQRFTFQPVKGSACEQNPQEQESRYCHACHAVER
ncbi:MAG: multiheme c-type cytochrome [Anaerolineales bacterium]